MVARLLGFLRFWVICALAVVVAGLCDYLVEKFGGGLHRRAGFRERFEPRCGNLAAGLDVGFYVAGCFLNSLGSLTLDVRNNSLVVHGPGYHADLPELDFAEVADACLVVVEDYGVVADGELAQNSVFDKRPDVAAEGGVADFGFEEQAVCIFAELQRLTDGEQALVMPGKDFHPSNAFGDCLREGARLDDVAAAVDVGEYCAVAGEGSFFLVVVLQCELNRFELSPHTSVLHSLRKGTLPGAFPHALGIIRRRHPQI